MATNNSINLSDTGIVTYDGAGAFTASTVTEGGVLLGGASNAISDTGVLTKGSLLVGDGSGAPTELTVGTNDYVLTADSAQGSGVKWAAASGGGTKTVYLYPTANFSSSAGHKGGFYTVSAGSSGSFGANWYVPSDFTSLSTAHFILIPDATETIQFDIDFYVAAVGEAYNADTRSSSNVTADVTVDILYAVDISSYLTGLAVGDFVGMEVDSDTSTLDCLGYRITYT